MTSLHVWFELIIIPLYMFIVLPSSSPLLLIHFFHFTILSLYYSDLFQVCYPLYIIFTHLIITSIYFIYLFINIIFTLGTLRSMAREFFCTCCSLYMRAWVLIIGYLGLVPFISITLLPSLHYFSCLKTTLRPWDQMLSSTAPTWISVWDLVDI